METQDNNFFRRHQGLFSPMALGYATADILPLAFETLGPICSNTLFFISDIGRLIALQSRDNKEESFLLQGISATIRASERGQRGQMHRGLAV